MFKKISIVLAILLISTMAFAQDIRTEVKNSYLDRFPSKTIGETLQSYPWFSNSGWQNLVMEDGKVAVICWNMVDSRCIEDSSIKSLAIGFRFVFFTKTKFRMDKIFILYCKKSKAKDMVGLEENIDRMYDEIYAENSRFIVNVINAIDKGDKR